MRFSLERQHYLQELDRVTAMQMTGIERVSEQLGVGLKYHSYLNSCILLFQFLFTFSHHILVNFSEV